MLVEAVCLRGTHLGIIAATDLAGTIPGIRLGITAHGIAPIIIAGMIPGTMDGMTHSTLHGDGHITDIIAGTRHIGTVDTILIIHIILAEVVIISLTEEQAMQVL